MSATAEKRQTAEFSCPQCGAAAREFDDDLAGCPAGHTFTRDTFTGRWRSLTYTRPKRHRTPPHLPRGRRR